MFLQRSVRQFFGARGVPVAIPRTLGDDITGDKPMAPAAPGMDAATACSPSGIASYTQGIGGGWTVVCNDGKTVTKPGVAYPVKTLGPIAKTGGNALKPGVYTQNPIVESGASCAAKGMAFNVQTKQCEALPAPKTPPPSTMIMDGGMAPATTTENSPPPPQEEGLSTGVKAALGVAVVAAVGTAAFVLFGSKRGASTRASNPVRSILREAAIDPSTRDAFSDAWSPELNAAWGNKQKPERDIDFFRSKKWLSLAQLASLMRAVCPSYNGFDIEAVVETLEAFGPDAFEYQVAREGSPAIYVRAKRASKQALKSLVTPHMMTNLFADEVDVETFDRRRLAYLQRDDHEEQLGPDAAAKMKIKAADYIRQHRPGVPLTVRIWWD